MILKQSIREARAGDTSAFKAIFDTLHDRLFAYALMQTKNRDDALDIVQETFIDLWHALEKFEYERDEAFYGFVFVILKRKIYRCRLKRSSSVSIENIEIREESAVSEDYRHLHKHINTLSPQHQQLLRMRYWAGLPFKKIATALNIKETTAKVWHHRALSKLKGNVKKYDI